MSRIFRIAFSSTFLILLLFIKAGAQQVFTVDLTDSKYDLFKVTLQPEKLSEKNNVFQFAATAPGTYQQMDIGRFVREFKAFDEAGNEVPVNHISLNQWELSKPAAVRKITYSVKDLWDTTVAQDQIYAMCSSTLGSDNALITGQCVSGYFKGMQSEPIKIKFDYPEGWTVGTALEKDSDGFYRAETFDKLVDSPFLLGRLSTAEMDLGDSKIDIYTYSKTGMIKSANLVDALKNVLTAEDRFMSGLPVKHYTFLFYFGDFSAGAWEHSYSSDYVFREAPLDSQEVNSINTTVAHEFFHIMTPLNIHSELVEKFNFEKPVFSQHLWLYEGVTEWAANIMELRDNLITLNEYLDRISDKLRASDYFNQNISLTELGINSGKLQNQYVNIYQKGAVVAGLLDIRLLELSHGKRGLREVLNELSKQYGPEKSFNESTFFDDFTAMTYPEIADFFNRYIKKSEELPVKEYYGKLGISYDETAGYDSTHVRSGLQLGVNGLNIVVASANKQAASSGILEGDILYKLGNDTLSLHNANLLMSAVRKLKVGDQIKITVMRNGTEHEITLKMQPSEIRHKFSVMENPAPGELMLRNAWLKNL